MITKEMIDDALRYIGVTKGKVDDDLLLKVKETFTILEGCLSPKYIYRQLPIEVQADKVLLKKTPYTIASRDLVEILHDCEHCYVLAATLGIEVDRLISRTQHASMLEAMIVDSCASVLIDKVCDDAESVIMGQLGEGKYLSMRFSPGYGDVPLDTSLDILEILAAPKSIGLTMTKSHMLLPTKSITAIIGEANQKQNRKKSCGKCYLVKSCMYRRRGERCGN